MIRTLRASRSLPSLRSTALSHASHPVPALPTEFCLNASRPITTAATTPKRTRKTPSSMLSESATPLMEPKKRGRPRKNTITPTIHKRSNSTDSKPAAAKKSQRGDPVPTIPQPSSSDAKAAPAEKGKKPQKGESNVPTAADKYREQAPAPEATSHKSEISASDPNDLGTRVQVVGAQAAEGAQYFANKAVESLDSANAQGVKDLLQKTLSKATPGGGDKEGPEKGHEQKQQKDGEIPSGEKNALLAALGLTGLWVVFGGRFQKKSGSKK